MSARFRFLRLAAALLSVTAATMVVATPAEAQAPARKLFLSVTTDDPWRAWMALSFAEQVQARGHGVTVWLVNEGVRLAVREPGQQAKDANAQLRKLIDKGVAVLVCQGCMAQAGVKADDLMPGARLSTPDTTIPLALDPQAATLSW